MDIGKSISFVFEDKKWIEKVLIGGLITLLTVVFSWTIIVGVIGGALLLGYMVQLVRNVRKHDDYPLPAWDEWGEKIMSGIKLMVVFFVWAIPLMIVSLPFAVLMGVAGNNDSGGFAGILALCFSCLTIIYAVVLFLAGPAITIRFSETEKISSGFEFSEILAFTRDHIGDIIIAMIVLWLVQLVASFIGSLLCFIGLAFTGIWAMMVQGHLYGQIGLEDADVATGDDLELSPGDIMPGVGELTDSVQDSAEKAPDAITDVSDSVEDVVDAGEEIAESAEEAVDAGEEIINSDD